MLIFLDHIINSPSQADVIYLDISNAFDIVSHAILLNKLQSTGISGIFWAWFKEYLTDRYQCVCINNCYSDLLPGQHTWLYVIFNTLQLTRTYGLYYLIISVGRRITNQFPLVLIRFWDSYAVLLLSLIPPVTLYISMVRSQLLYCTQIWHLHLMKDILSLEQIQHCATKFLLNDYTSN